MKKDIKNALNEKMQVKLPETLNKENILSELENTENNIIEMQKKKKLLSQTKTTRFLQRRTQAHSPRITVFSVVDTSTPQTVSLSFRANSR